MTARKERIAWLAFVAIIALAALRPGTRVTPTQRDLDFASTLIELRQQVDRRYVRDVADEELRSAAIRGMFFALDEFSGYVPPAEAEDFRRDLRGNFRGVGILIDPVDEGGGLLVVRPIEHSPAEAAGVKPGDRIVAVDGEEVLTLPRPAIIEKITGPIDTMVTLTIERGPAQQRQRLDLVMPRKDIMTPVLEGYGRDEQGQPVFWVDPDAAVKLGYIRLTRFTPGCAARTDVLIEELLKQGMQGLVLDLRDNPGGLLDEATQLADLFLESGVIYSKHGEHSPSEVEYARPEGTLPQFPLVVLINEGSASASEVLAGALADHQRAVMVGARTYGKGSVQDVIQMSDQGELKLTTAHYYLPSGRLVHKLPGNDDWGVLPDVQSLVDYADPAEVGRIGREPLFPRQAHAAVETLLGLIAARDQSAAGGPSTRP